MASIGKEANPAETVIIWQRGFTAKIKDQSYLNFGLIPLLMERGVVVVDI